MFQPLHRGFDLECAPERASDFLSLLGARLLGRASIAGDEYSTCLRREIYLQQQKAKLQRQHGKTLAEAEARVSLAHFVNVNVEGMLPFVLDVKRRPCGRPGKRKGGVVW